MLRASIAGFVLVLGLGLVTTPAGAQAPGPQETKASVPALDAMHDVIMPMWHDAWPNKDYKALAALVPAIEKHVAALDRAELPGILRDKQGRWMSALAELKATVRVYKAAADEGRDADLLKAAETLHMQYEGMVKIVRPVLKEMEDFHASLYILYHYQMNPFAMAEVTATVQTMQVKMGALNKAALPDRMKAKTEAFTAQRARLSSAVDAVAALLPAKNEAKLKEAIELMHAEYEKLEKVFE
jgi:hypothetical protein